MTEVLILVIGYWIVHMVLQKKLDFLIEGVTEVKIEVMEWGDNIYMHHIKD